MVFPLGTWASCRHLFISSASLSWMEVNILNQKPSIPSWSGVFKFDIFSVILSKSMCIFAFEPSLSPSNTFLILFIHLVFSLCSLVANIIRSLLHLIVCMFSYHLLPVVGRNFFRCFVMSCFICIVLPFVDISLIFLLSSGFSDSFPQVVLLFFLVLPFPFCLYMFKSFSFVLSFWPVFVDFFYLRF